MYQECGNYVSFKLPKIVINCLDIVYNLLINKKTKLITERQYIVDMI